MHTRYFPLAVGYTPRNPLVLSGRCLRLSRSCSNRAPATGHDPAPKSDGLHHTPTRPAFTKTVVVSGALSYSNKAPLGQTLEETKVFGVALRGALLPWRGCFWHGKSPARGKPWGGAESRNFYTLLQRTGDLARTQAAGAGVDITGASIHNRLDPDNIRFPSSV